MSDLNTPSPSADTQLPLRQRSFFMRIAISTLGHWGARLGVVWVIVMVLLAVFAPFLANSHPILMKEDGSISSPLLAHLSAVDLMLLVGLLGVLVLPWIRAISPAIRTAIWVGLVLVTYIVGSLVIQLPENIVYAKYREATATGQIEWAIHTLIPFSPNDYQRDKLRAGANPSLLLPSSQHLMGTTSVGADVASRMIHASRIALTIGLLATSIAATIGIIVGGLMGYFSGRVDLFGMRMVEIFSAIPVIFLLIMIVAFYGRSLYLMTIILGLTGWVGYALFVRAEFLKIRQMDYVAAARASSLPLWSVLFRHMLPNGITPVLVLASFGIASMILTESTLSFLGLGLEQDPSWGQMLNDARHASHQWGLVIFPGLAIFLTVFAYNLIGEALRDALDPHVNQKRD